MADGYNSEKLRETATRIDALSEQLDGGCAQELRRALGRLEPWQGSAKEACQARIEERHKAVTSEIRCLRQIAQALRAYADKLDETDHQLSIQL